ncbi:MAG: hypothetical protein K8S23_15750 [Candidatus Cloacimonetes bacterium]|nr:hypothetical protein [Candidatus Cloacimonadota bacterium]
MKRLILFILFVCIICSSLFSQNNVQSNNHNNCFTESDSLPGTNLSDFTFDRNGILWIISLKFNHSSKTSPFSSNFSTTLFISKKVNNKYYTIKDNLEFGIKNIVFDNLNTLYILGDRQIMMLNNESKLESVFELTMEGGFNSIAFDNNNNIWVGGLQTGILMYDSNTWITYNTDNSSLPTNSSTSIFIDKNNIKWITLWEKKGILKIKNQQWTYFNENDSNLLNQNFWCATVDFDNNLWLGTGWQQSAVKIVEYSGNKWLINNPTNDDGKSITGTIRTLFTDYGGNIWSVSSLTKKRATVGSLLSKYDGNNWQNFEIEDANLIREIDIDKEGNIWILSKNRIIQVTE